MKKTDTDEIKFPKYADKSEIDEIIANDKKLLEQEEIKMKKLQKKMIIFGIILVVLIIAYVVLDIISKKQ